MQAPAITPDTPSGGATEAPGRSRNLAAAALGLGAMTLMPLCAGRAEAGPMVCNTSLEAPIVATRDAAGSATVPSAPVEVTRCLPVETTPAVMERRAYTWTSPYARGVSVINQVTDFFGIAMGGLEGNRVMGFGFPDQTIIWDGTAIQNTSYALLEQQSNPMPMRTPDLVSVFNTSLGSGGRLAQPASLQEGGMPRYYVSPPLPQNN